MAGDLQALAQAVQMAGLSGLRGGHGGAVPFACQTNQPGHPCTSDAVPSCDTMASYCTTKGVSCNGNAAQCSGDNGAQCYSLAAYCTLGAAAAASCHSGDGWCQTTAYC